MFLTRCDDLAEDVDAVDDRAVPTTMSKLMLALADRKLSAMTHSCHILGVTSAHSPLTPRQSSQATALGV